MGTVYSGPYADAIGSYDHATGYIATHAYRLTINLVERDELAAMLGTCRGGAR